MGVTQPIVGLAIRIYHGSPLYPHLGGYLARLLSLYHKAIGRTNKGTVVHSPGGFEMVLDLNEVIDSQLYYCGTFEPEALQTFRLLVKPGETVIDVGANTGWMTLNLARLVGSAGRVIAFEPTGRALLRLRENVLRNAAANVEIAPHALGDKQGVEQMMIKSSYRIDGRDDTTQEEIEVRTLDAYLQEHPVTNLSFIKIDTDGMEEKVIRGASRTLEQFRPSILFEVSRDQGCGEQSKCDLCTLLHDLGYQFCREGTLDPIGDIESFISRIEPGTTANVVARPGLAHSRKSNQLQR